MKEIRLTNGKYAIVDDEDFELVNKFNWFETDGYAKQTTAKQTIKGKRILMHRLILGVTNPKIYVDHINGVTLDNRKSNLRICSPKENSRNRKRPAHNKTGFKGVSIGENKKWKNYVARIVYDGKMIYLGSYDTPEKAAIAYNQKALELFGEYARLNRFNGENEVDITIRYEPKKIEISEEDKILIERISKYNSRNILKNFVLKKLTDLYGIEHCFDDYKKYLYLSGMSKDGIRKSIKEVKELLALPKYHEKL